MTGSIEGFNWTVRNANQLFQGALGPSFTATTFQVFGIVAAGLPDMGPNKCKYAPPPFDVIGRTLGLPAAAFDDFPITVLP